MFATAHQHLQAGRLADAEEVCRQVLTTNPRHIESLNLLASIALRVGRPREAVELFGAAIAVNGRIPELHFNCGVALQALGRLEEAIAHFAKATKLKPSFAAAHTSLGAAYGTQGRLVEAAEHFRCALAHAPNDAAAHRNVGSVLRMLGRLDEAAASLRRALAIRPDFADAHNDIGIVLAAQGKAGEAAGHFQYALALQPGLADASINLAGVLLAEGRVSEAMAAAMAALAIGETAATRTLFAKCVAASGRAADAGQARHLIGRALAEGWDRPIHLASAAARLIKGDVEIGECIRRAAAAWPRRLPPSELFGPSGLTRVCADPLLRSLLETAPVTDVALERFLTMARGALLEQATGTETGGHDADLVAFGCALAQQCFINEYVFAATEEEIARAQRLRTALGTVTLPSALQLAVVGAYFPLHSVDVVRSLRTRFWPDAVSRLLTQQVDEPGAEADIRASIPRLTAIDDEVSLQVRQQYEENPYPRWVKAAAGPPFRNLDEYFRTQFPLAPIRDLGKADVDILIAGCGTGQDTVELAQRLPRARLLAVDLSLTSLAYAKRMAREAGCANIDFAQADILKLAAVERQFDVIVAGGVLHHLADPLAGWQVLLSRLRPGGLMRFGLYSALARRDVAAARAFIAERGYGRTAADIRRCRQDLMALADDAVVKNVVRSRDFFTLSGCRDLLFHVQEHHFTLPKVKRLLAQTGLKVVGFDIRSEVRQNYRKRFPGDPRMSDLDLWHAFETENPDTFVGMYQFWAQHEGAMAADAAVRG